MHSYFDSIVLSGLYPDPFANGFLPVAGLQNVYGIPKPSYRAFQLMHWAGDTLVQVNPDFLAYDTLSAFAVTGNNTSIFFTNWNIKKKPPTDQVAQVYVEGTSHFLTLSINDTCQPLCCN